MMLDLNTYDAFIFDLGGVLLRIDPANATRAFAGLPFHDFARDYARVIIEGWYSQLEAGRLTEDELWRRMLPMLSEPVPVAELEQAWNQMLLDFVPENVEWVRAAGRSRRVFLLSNSNAIHFRRYDADFRRQFGHSLPELFHKAYFSHELEMLKPEARIYEHVLRDAGLEAGRTLFIDDSLPNVEAARALGIGAIHYKGEGLRELLGPPLG